MVKSLGNKWKELLFSFSGFGPNFLMVVMGAYFTDAINPAALGNDSFQAISNTCLILPALFPILWMIAKAFDGIIDIPFAALTDNMSTKWGKRRPAIAACFIPMIISYVMCWNPIGGDNQLVNTIWVVIWALVFFSSYTMCLIAFYGSFATVCTNEAQRMRVSGFKAFFDTISYCLAYALIPVILQVTKTHIDKFVMICVPLMLTMIIPLFMIKEGEKYGYPENEGASPEKINIVKSLKLTFGNRIFRQWLIVNSCSFFGLQMFLVGMNAMILGGMGFNGTGMTVLNTFAFAPVPIMLYLFGKLKAKRGMRFAFQSCLLTFAVSILCFIFGSLYVCGPDNVALQYAIGIIGSVTGSWAIGSFFMIPYAIPAQIAGVEQELTGRNHSAMYFAAQAVVTSVVGAIASSLVYENIKMLFISKAAKGVVYAESFDMAAEIFGVSVDQVFNLGTLLVPIIVSITCILGFVFAFKMPRDYSAAIVAEEFKKDNPDLDISAYISDTTRDKEEKGEIIFVQIGLSILSGFIFGFIWVGVINSYLKKLLTRYNSVGMWFLTCLVPYASIVTNIRIHRQLKEKAKAAGVKLWGSTLLYILTGIILPVLPVNIVAMAFLQRDINKLVNLND